jgi:tetratricopeptide (TPR) repeat protein
MLMLASIMMGGCSGFSRRVRPDDVIAARQIARKGADATHLGDWERAAQFYAEAVEVCPVDEQVRARYAETLWNLGQQKEAAEHQREAMRLSGGEPALMIRLGEMYLAQGDLQQSSTQAQRVIDSGRESAAAHRLHGDVLQRQGKWREALAAYHRALSIQPHYPEVQLAAAQVYQRMGRPQRAWSTLQSLVESYPSGEEPAELLYGCGLALASLGRHPQAVNYFTQAEARGLASAELQYRLAESHRLAGNPAAAAACLIRARELQAVPVQSAARAEVPDEHARVARLPD